MNILYTGDDGSESLYIIEKIDDIYNVIPSEGLYELDNGIFLDWIAIHDLKVIVHYDVKRNKENETLTTAFSDIVFDLFFNKLKEMTEVQLNEEDY